VEPYKELQTFISSCYGNHVVGVYKINGADLFLPFVFHLKSKLHKLGVFDGKNLENVKSPKLIPKESHISVTLNKFVGSKL
jgi:hypothetical protein